MTVPTENYNIIDNSSGKFLVNKKDKLELMVPSGWNTQFGIDMMSSASDDKIVLYSPDFNYFPATGCIAQIMTRRLSENKNNFRSQSIDKIQTTLNDYNEMEPTEGYSMSIVSIDKLEALQKTHILEDKNKKAISIEIPTLNRIYYFEFVLFSKECNQQFDNLLNTVKIK